MTDEQNTSDASDVIKPQRTRRASVPKKTPAKNSTVESAMGEATAASVTEATSEGEAPASPPHKPRRKSATPTSADKITGKSGVAKSPAAKERAKTSPKDSALIAENTASEKEHTTEVLDALSPTPEKKPRTRSTGKSKKTAGAPLAEAAGGMKEPATTERAAKKTAEKRISTPKTPDTSPIDRPSPKADSIAAENAATHKETPPPVDFSVPVNVPSQAPMAEIAAPLADVGMELKATLIAVEAHIPAKEDLPALSSATLPVPQVPAMPPQRLEEAPTAPTVRAVPETRPEMVDEAAPVIAMPGTASDTVSGVAPDPAAHTEAETEDSETESAPRKNRRGRRGGRGRGRGKPRLAAQGEGADPSQAPPSPESSPAIILPSEDDDLDDEDDDEEVFSAREQGRDKGKGGRTQEAVEAVKPGRRKMFISVVEGEQVEVALVEEGAIGEYYLEMLHQAKAKGNIYKGVVHNVDTNLQAAFVNYGAGKNGFLQIDEIHSEYYLAPHEVAKGKKFPPIQKVIKQGQEVLVQVVKEPTGNKGAFLTTWLSLAGRFLVLTPGQEQIGVSRKVDNDEERARLREMMNGIEPGEGLGVIVRTVSAGTSKTTLKNDLQYLKRAWKEIRRRGTADPVPSLIYREPGLAERAVRDYLTEDVCEVWVDNASVAESLRETVALLFPRKKDLVRVHVDLRQTLWERFNLQRQLEQIYSREVNLPSGGRLVFDQTEALMAIDINSGKISGKGNFESMALKTNLEAAEAIARHLKLRDIGGQIVVDFIEMRDKNHVRDVEKTLRNAMKNDRARHDVARMSSFGLMEIVRQRTGSSALAVTMESCPSCGGTGLRRNMEWQSLQALRQIGRQARVSATSGKCFFETSAELGMYLLNHKRDRLREMEQQLQVAIEIRVQP